MDRGNRPIAGSHVKDEIHLRDVRYLLVRSRLLIAATVAAGVVATATYNHRTVPVFDVATTIRISDSGATLPVIGALRTLPAGNDIETEMEVLRSRTLAEAVVDSLGLPLRVVSPRGVARSQLLHSIVVQRWAPSDVYELERQADSTFSVTATESGMVHGLASASIPAALPGATFYLRPHATELERITLEVLTLGEAVERLQRHLIVSRPNREARIVTVRYQSPDTQLVHEVPNALASAFIAQGQAARKIETTSTVRFLEEQIDTLSTQLVAAEEALTAFREGERVVSIQTEARSQVTQLTRLQGERDVLETERSALQKLVAEIDEAAATADPGEPSPYVRLISFPTVYRNRATSELLRSLNEANTQRSQLLERRTMQDPDVVGVTRRIHELEEQLRATAITYLQGLSNQVRAYDETLSRFGSELESIPAREAQLARLQRQADVLGDVYTLLESRLHEARVLEAVEDVSVRVVDPAVLPSAPARPKKLLNLLIGAFFGGMLGVMVAFAREYLDNSVHTRDDMRRSTGGAPVLGVIPRLRRGASEGVPDPTARPSASGLALITEQDPRSPGLEAYRTLRTNLTFTNPDAPPKSIVITSPLPREGKSTSAANLTLMVAEQGIRALLVDADLRHGSLHSVFGVPKEPGLTDLLTGKAHLAEVIQDIDLGEAGRAHLLPTGPYPLNPAEMLGSERMGAALRSLEEAFDLIVLDSAPLALVTDAAVLGARADGVVLVARASETEMDALAYAVELLHRVQAVLLGSVLNDLDVRRDSRHGSGHDRYGLAPVGAGS